MNELNPCLICGSREPVVWVHGHGQCAHCKTNIAPCCDGDTMGMSFPSQGCEIQKKPVKVF